MQGFLVALGKTHHTHTHQTKIISSAALAAAVGGRGTLIDQSKLQLALDAVDAVEDDADTVSKGIGFAGALADDLAGGFVEGVAVVVHGVERDEALDEEVGEFDEDSVLGDADDESVEVFADAVGHELHLLPLDQFALGGVGAALGEAGVFGLMVEFGLGDGARERGVMGFGFRCFLGGSFGGFLRSLRARPERFGVLLDVASDADGDGAFMTLGAFGQDAFEDAMDQEVRKAADGRGEVGITGGGESEVAVIDFRVSRLFERAQHEVADDALLGLAGDFGGELLIHRRG